MSQCDTSLYSWERGSYIVEYNVVWFLFCSTTVRYIEKGLSTASQLFWSQRATFDHIVLLDWSSNKDSLTTGTPINSLKDALYKVSCIHLSIQCPMIKIYFSAN